MCSMNAVILFITFSLLIEFECRRTITRAKQLSENLSTEGNCESSKKHASNDNIIEIYCRDVMVSIVGGMVDHHIDVSVQLNMFVCK